MKSGADREIAARLFMSRYGLVVGVAVRFAPAPDLVYDIVQQSFLDFIKDVENNNRDLERDVTPLLYRITKNRALKCWNEKRRNRSEVLQQIAERIAFDPQPEDLARMENEVQTLHDCMDKLPEYARNLIEQHYFQKRSMEEIAKQEQRKPGSIRQAFCRIRLKLRECIEQKLKIGYERRNDE